MVSVTIIGILLFFKQNSFASWREGETGIQYEDENGELTTGFCKIDEKLYYFDKNGYLVTGKFFCEDDQKYYYADESGVIMTGFISHDGYRYYLNSDGTRVSDTILEIDGTAYVFNKDGSVDENATTMYPVYQYMQNKHLGIEENEQIIMNSKIQACAILRASDLQNGYATSDEEKTALQDLLKNRGVKSTGGYEFSYGGIADYGIERLMEDMEKDSNLQQVLLNPALAEVGLGLYSVENVYYYDVILTCKQ